MAEVEDAVDTDRCVRIKTVVAHGGSNPYPQAGTGLMKGSIPFSHLWEQSHIRLRWRFLIQALAATSLAA